METVPPVIQLDGITKIFATDEVETHALSNVHVTIARGEYVSIAGPSGCGKSTLLSILGLLDSTTEGSYAPNSRPVATLKASERARARNRPIGFISPSFILTGNLDSKSGEAVMDLLHELHRNGATICMVTHDPRYARHAERSILLFDGRIVDAPVEPDVTD